MSATLGPVGRKEPGAKKRRNSVDLLLGPTLVDLAGVADWFPYYRVSRVRRTGLAAAQAMREQNGFPEAEASREAVRIYAPCPYITQWAEGLMNGKRAERACHCSCRPDRRSGPEISSRDICSLQLGAAVCAHVGHGRPFAAAHRCWNSDCRRGIAGSE